MASNELERIALEKRDQLIARNTYNSSSDDNRYSATHSRAKADSETPENGKGLANGTHLDVYDENAGSSTDKYGDPSIVGTGRIKNVATNQYDKDKIYEEPDTTKNIGQVNF